MLTYSKIKPECNMSWKVTTKPAAEPVEASDVKLYARIDGSSEDTLIEGFITAVREATEKYLGRALITQSITASFNEWPESPIELPRPPLVSIIEVRTVDEEGSTTTYSSDNYFARTIIEPGEFIIKFDKTEPQNEDRYFGGYEIEYVAGYGNAEDVPQAIKLGITMWVADVYENRVPIDEPPAIVRTILVPYRIINI